MDYRQARMEAREWELNAPQRSKERADRAASKEALLDAMHPEREAAREAERARLEAERAEKTALIERRIEQEYPDLPCDGPYEQKHRERYRTYLEAIGTGQYSTLKIFRRAREGAFVAFIASVLSLMATIATLNIEGQDLLADGVAVAAMGTVLLFLFLLLIFAVPTYIVVKSVMVWRRQSSDEHRKRYLRWRDELQQEIAETDADLRFLGVERDDGK